MQPSQGAMLLSQFLASNNLAIQTSRGDGHYLLYSVCESCRSQFTSDLEVDLNAVKDKIFIEVLQHRDEYLPFMTKPTHCGLMKELRAYLLYRRYNSDFGDMVSLMIANALQTKI